MHKIVKQKDRKMDKNMKQINNVKTKTETNKQCLN